MPLLLLLNINLLKLIKLTEVSVLYCANCHMLYRRTVVLMPVSMWPRHIKLYCGRGDVSLVKRFASSIASPVYCQLSVAVTNHLQERLDLAQFQKCHFWPVEGMVGQRGKESLPVSQDHL